MPVVVSLCGPVSAFMSVPGSVSLSVSVPVTVYMSGCYGIAADTF